jgi:hypothetical protein
MARGSRHVEQELFLMKRIRIGAVLLAAVAVASGAATAQAGGSPATGGGYKLTGTLSGYVQATQKKPGSITITVAPSRVVTPGYSVTLRVTMATKIYSSHKITDGDSGVVELQSQSMSAPVVAVYDLR